MKKHRYTSEQIEYVRKTAPGTPIEDLVDLFNRKYSTAVTYKSMQGIMYRNDIRTNMQGYKTRFVKGQKSWCKGMKGLDLGGSAGWFKKGHTPSTHKPIGSETFQEGTVWIKTAEPNVWRRKHLHLWETHYGEVPDDCYVHFKDNDKLNVTIDNLYLVRRGAFASVRKRKLQSNNPELNVAIHKLTELELKIKDYEGAE